MLKELIKPNTILVVGDFMLDSYWLGNVARISPEAPVPVFQKRNQWSVVGGAANVVANLLASGKKVLAASVIGRDKEGDELLACLYSIGCNCEMLQRSPERKTTKKTRILAQNNQQLLRIDEEEVVWLSKQEEDLLLEEIEAIIPQVSGIILSDYLKGILSASLCQKIISLGKEHHIPVFCDVKDSKVEKYKGATLLKPNKKELSLLTGMPVTSKEEISRACSVLCERCENDYILVTLGAQGLALFSKESGAIDFIQAEPREVYDVSGAGDTVISYFVACVTSGIGFKEAAQYANRAAGIKVGKVGTSTVSLDELDQDLEKEKLLKNTQVNVSASKIQDLDKLLELLHKQPDKKIVFTNGCFDILHVGHVRYLQEAARLGDVLIVAVNSDESVKRLKGPRRPINTLADRLNVLAGLESVTYLVPFEEDTPEALIRAIKPNVLVKGAEYKGKFISGSDFVKANGGEVVLIPMVEGYSTTNLIKKSGEV